MVIRVGRDGMAHDDSEVPRKWKAIGMKRKNRVRREWRAMRIKRGERSSTGIQRDKNKVSGEWSAKESRAHKE
jgi:hypothetical protein